MLKIVSYSQDGRVISHTVNVETELEKETHIPIIFESTGNETIDLLASKISQANGLLIKKYLKRIESCNLSTSSLMDDASAHLEFINTIQEALDTAAKDLKQKNQSKYSILEDLPKKSILYTSLDNGETIIKLKLD